MLLAEVGSLAIYIMQKKGILTQEEFRQYKNEWIAMRNRQIIEDIKKKGLAKRSGTMLTAQEIKNMGIE